MENIRINFENGLQHQVETLARRITRWEENGWEDDIVKIDLWDRIYGYILAGFYSGIITDEEFSTLWDEVDRWKFSR